MASVSGMLRQMVDNWFPRDERAWKLPSGSSNLLKRMKAPIRDDQTVVIIYLDIEQFGVVRQAHGRGVAASILGLVERNLRSEIPKYVESSGKPVVQHLWADDFVVSYVLDERVSRQSLLETCLQLKQRLEALISSDTVKIIGNSLRLHVGFSIVERENDDHSDLPLYQALKESQLSAKGSMDIVYSGQTEELRNLIKCSGFHAVFQPIASLKDGETLGWESLLRGPKGSPLEAPTSAFALAEKAGLVEALEELGRNRAIEEIGPLEPSQRLFVNVHHTSLSSPRIMNETSMSLLRQNGLAPENIVFEISERYSVTDYPALRETVRHYRRQGYRIAVDDAGSGFSGLQAIAELQPDYIKVDMALVRDVDRDLARRAVIEAVVHLANRLNATVIAEGIETQAELNTLIAAGVRYGQGYYLGRPAFPKPKVSRSAKGHIRHMSLSGMTPRPRSISEIAIPALVVDENMLVMDAKEELDSQRSPIRSIVIGRDGRPVGLLMRQNIYRLLSLQYGVALFANKPVGQVMDKGFLAVLGSESIDNLSDLTIHRNVDKMYDDIVVIDEAGALIGIVPVNLLLDCLNRTQMELAKGANPLTGLPGNIAIEEELARQSKEGSASTVIYADLDDFKSYNDAFGFEAGDRVITLLARILTHVAQKSNRPGFVGHIGGDDFIVICAPADAAKISERAIRLLTRLAPTVSVSLALVDCRTQAEYRAIGPRSAQVKRRAKSIPGNVFVNDNAI